MGATALPVRQSGYRTRYFGYSATLETMPQIVARLVHRLEEVKPSIVIGHSLGCILLRMAIPECPTLKIEHFFMLGPPNQSPRIARYFWNWWPFRWFSRSCGQFLVTQSEYEKIPKLTVPYTVFAGAMGMPKWFDPFHGEPNDRIVSVSETTIDAEHPPVIVPAEHSLFTYSWYVRQHIRKQLSGNVKL